MRRNLASAMLYDWELSVMKNFAEATNWPQTEIVSYFVRRGMNTSFDYVDNKTFSDDVGRLVTEAAFQQYKQSNLGKAALENEAKEKSK